MTTKHAIPALRRRKADGEHSAAEGAAGAMQGPLGRADMRGREPAGTLGAQRIVLSTVKPDLYTDTQDP